MTLSRRSSRLLAASVALVALLAFAVPAEAQVLDANLEISGGEPTGFAMPEGDDARIPITITYDCGGLRGTVTITATADSQNVTGASAGADPATFEAQSPPDCTLGSDAATVNANITVGATKETPVGTDIPVRVEVTGTNALDAAQAADPITVTAVAGPYIEVTFTPREDTFEVPAGERAPVYITIESMSNVMVMGMPMFVMPEGWTKPTQTPINVESPLVEGQNGTSAFEFEVLVPANAEPGEFTVEFVTYAHTMGDVGPTLQTENETIPLTFTVTERSGGGGGDDEESPGLAPFPLAILGALTLALLRRRT